MATFSFQSNQIHPPLQMLRRKKGVKSKIWACRSLNIGSVCVFIFVFVFLKSKIWACRSLNIGLFPCDSEYVSRTAASFQLVALNLSNLGNTCCLSKNVTNLISRYQHIYCGRHRTFSGAFPPHYFSWFMGFFCSSSHIGLIQFAWLSESRIAKTHLQFSIQSKGEIIGNNGNLQKRACRRNSNVSCVPII